MGQTALLLLRRKACWGFFSPWKDRWLRSGLNPRIWVPKASTLPIDNRSRREQINFDHKLLLRVSSITCYFIQMSTFQVQIWCWETEAISTSRVYFMHFMRRTTTGNSELTLYYRSVHSLPSLQALHLLEHSQRMKSETPGVLMRENYSLMTGQHRDVDDDIQSRVCCQQSRVILQVTYIHVCFNCLNQAERSWRCVWSMEAAFCKSLKTEAKNFRL